MWIVIIIAALFTAWTIAQIRNQPHHGEDGTSSIDVLVVFLATALVSFVVLATAAAVAQRGC